MQKSKYKHPDGRIRMVYNIDHSDALSDGFLPCETVKSDFSVAQGVATFVPAIEDAPAIESLIEGGVIEGEEDIPAIEDVHEDDEDDAFADLEGRPKRGRPPGKKQ